MYAVNECLLNGTSGHLRLFSGAMWDRFTVRDASDRVRVGSDCGLGSIGLQKKSSRGHVYAMIFEMSYFRVGLSL